MRRSGSSGVSVVTCVVRARFFTNPQDSPSGVSEGQSTPQWDGCSARGPLIFLVFSNCELILVIIPIAEMYESRVSSAVTLDLSILKRLMFQFPDFMAA